MEDSPSAILVCGRVWVSGIGFYLCQLRRGTGDDGPALATIPKRRADGKRGLVSEHVVPKKVMKRLLLDPPESIADLLRLNFCAVVSHGRYVTFQLAEVAVPRDLFRKILSLIR